ncbi:MAG: DUF4276 family protein [bacterium]
MRKILILVEGQTEEMFVKKVLNTDLEQFDRYAVPIIIATKKVKRGNQFRGGVPHYDRVKLQIQRLLNDTSAALVTTFIDYYALPDSFPGKSSLQGTTPTARVQYLEQAIQTDINNSKFTPYYSLHEFEALLFSVPEEIAQSLTSPSHSLALQRIRQGFPSPEDINDNPHTCPSARIRGLFPTYQKPLHGSLISQRIGIYRIRSACTHFHEWLLRLEAV